MSLLVWDVSIDLISFKITSSCVFHYRGMDLSWSYSSEGRILSNPSVATFWTMASHHPSGVSNSEWASVRTLLLLHGFDPDKPTSAPKGRGGIKWTPLNYACTRGWLLVCSYLVAHGADVRAADWSGTTPMKCACSAGKLHIAKWLYNNGAQDDVRRCDIGGTCAKRANFDSSLQSPDIKVPNLLPKVFLQ